ncbi:MAG: cupin domain-containing protein [Armatimonadota bacterium]|nr:cupin domain-containing protein [Armatimonadota bacterium]
MGEDERNLVGRTVEMAGLVEYQEGAVVSRTIIEREAGTVTLFAFGEGQGLSEHTTPYDALVYVLDGSAEITIANQTHTVAAGQMLILPADVPHALQADEAFKMLLVMIKS